MREALTARRLAACVLITVPLTAPLGWTIGSSTRFAGAPWHAKLAFGEFFAMTLVGVLTMLVGGVLCIPIATRRTGDVLLRFGAGSMLAALAMMWIAVLALAVR